MTEDKKETNLKTLKDLGTFSPSYGSVNINILRQEAIKWIKDRIRRCCGVEGLLEICDEHKFWMDRFNISEEDLN